MLNKFIYILIATVIGFTSCESLDQLPLDQLEVDTFWKNQAEAEYAITGLYNGWESGSQIFYMDCISDNSNSDFAHEGYQALGNGTANPTNAGNASSRYSYVHIRRANLILENLDKTPLTDEIRDRMKAEVRVIRAYRYLDLAILFGNVPLITNTTSLDESYIKASNRADIFAFVEKELTEASADLPRTNQSGRMSKGAALGFLARALAFQRKHQEVITITQQIMDLGIYNLFPNYANLFEEANKGNIEVISDIQYIEKTFGYTSLGIMLPNSLGGWSSIVPIQNLIDSYQTRDGETIEESSSYEALKPFKNRDPRFAATIVHPGSSYNGEIFNPLLTTSNNYPSGPNNASNTAYNYKKYIQNPKAYSNVWNVGINIITQRFAEILLLNAEAKIELGTIDNSVYENINRIRERAGIPQVNQTKYNNSHELRKLVRREFRSEFAGEGRRWFDIIRWGIAKDVMNGPVYGSLSNGTVNPNTGEVIFTSSTERFFVENRVFREGKNELWPIPQSVIDASKRTLQQNPGYN